MVSFYGIQIKRWTIHRKFYIVEIEKIAGIGDGFRVLQVPKGFIEKPVKVRCGPATVTGSRYRRSTGQYIWEGLWRL